MKKTVFILAICIAVILIVGCQKKEAPAEEEVQAEAAVEAVAEAPAIAEQEELTVELSLIEKVAKIAAMFEVDPVKGAVLLEEANLTQEEYEKALADITLDEEATKLFVEKKAEHIAEFQK